MLTCPLKAYVRMGQARRDQPACGECFYFVEQRPGFPSVGTCTYYAHEYNTAEHYYDQGTTSLSFSDGAACLYFIPAVD